MNPVIEMRMAAVNSRKPDFLQKVKTGYVCPKCGQGQHKGNGVHTSVKEPETWYCVSCKRGYSILGLYALYAGLPDDKTHFMDILEGAEAYYHINPAKLEPAKYSAPEKAAEADPDYVEYYKACRERVNDAAATSYLSARGITGEMIKRFWIGFDPAADPGNYPGAMDGQAKKYPTPRIIIPTCRSHYVTRRIDGKADLRLVNPKGSRVQIFNHALLDDKAVMPECVFVTESAFDAISIIMCGGEAVGLNSTTMINRFVDMAKAMPSRPVFALCLDNDESGHGQKSNHELKEKLDEAGMICFEAEICGKYKDANERLVADRQGLTEAVSGARAKAATLKAADALQTDESVADLPEPSGAEVVASFLSAIKTRKYEPIPTGLKEIDRVLYGGFFRQWIIMLGAPPGTGKTTFVQWIAEEMASRGLDCLYLNLEMSRDQMMAKSFSRIAARSGIRIPAAEVLQGYKWTTEQELAIMAAADYYAEKIAPRMKYKPEPMPGDEDGSSGSDLALIMNYLEGEAARIKAAGRPAPVVVLDYLQLVTSGKHDDAVGTIKAAISELKFFAMRHSTAVIIITANNRESNKSGVSGLNSSRDTSGIEYGADLLLSLDFTKCLQDKSKSYDDLTAAEKRELTFKIIKGRFSEAGGRVELIYDGAVSTFSLAEQASDAGELKTADFSWDQVGKI